MTTLYGVMLPECIWPCWTYALARIGKRTLLSPEWISETMPKHLRKIGDGTPYTAWQKPGTILVWSTTNSPNERSSFWEPVEMLPNGTPICRKVRYEYHAGVYEGSGLVSDMVTPTGGAELPLIIRQCKIEDKTPGAAFFLPLDSPALKME